jgi:regulator of sigma E protease
MLLTIIIFLLILTVLVLIHELGHFIVTKKLGIKVEEFGFGFPPRVFSRKIGETLYSFNLLPIGGFVKLYGEDEAGAGKLKPSASGDLPAGRQGKPSADLNRAFFARPIWQRALVVVAGVVMNFALAVVIISYLFAVPGVPTVSDKVLISNVVKGSPAQISGFKEGEIILSIDGKRVTNPSGVVSETRKRLGEKVTFKLEDPATKSTREVIVTPRRDFPKDQGPVGISIAQAVSVKKYPWYQAPFLGTKEVLKDSALIVMGLGTVISDIFTKAEVPAGVAGPVGIAQVTGKFVDSGINAVLSFVALLSLNLAVLNILPIPALDGGRFFFILVEAVTRRKVNARFEAYAHAVGIAILLALIAVITIHDFIRLLSGQPIIPTQ